MGGLRGGQHRDLEVHNEQPDEATAEYFEGSEEEEFLSLEEMDEMGLDEEDRDLQTYMPVEEMGLDEKDRDLQGPSGKSGYGSGYGGYGSSGYGSSGVSGSYTGLAGYGSGY